MSTASASAPPVPSRGIRIAGWSGLAAALSVVALIGVWFGQGGWVARDPLDPESAAPEGARAIARILSDEGVHVQVVRDRESALRALAEAPATLAMPDPVGMTDDAVLALIADAQEVVLLEPRSRTLDLLLSGSEFAGAVAEAPLSPACAEPAAQGTGAVVIGELYTAGDAVTGCYPAADGFGLLIGERVAAVEARAVLANEVLANEGNAALAVGLLGAQPTLVWYMPSPADANAAPPTLGELTPPWVTPAIVVLLLAAASAALWRGRRFGPLVAETLPVTVRGSETTIGRGRLYAGSRDAGHAAAQLRAGTQERLAAMLGLGAVASAAAVADAAATLTDAPAADVRDVLYARNPRDDRELVALHGQLRALEEAVRDRSHPGRRTP